MDRPDVVQLVSREKEAGGRERGDLLSRPDPAQRVEATSELIGGEIPVLICPCNPDLTAPARIEPGQARPNATILHWVRGSVGDAIFVAASGVVD